MWSRFIQFICFFLLLNSIASASDLNKLDGDWYSYKWKYGYSLSEGKGVAFATNSPTFKVGQEIVRLTSVGKNTFVGENIYKDGKFYKVKATLQANGKLLFEGEKNVKWEMERIDPETYSSIVNSINEKQSKSKIDKQEQKNYQNSDSEDVQPVPTKTARALTGPQKNAVRAAKQYLRFKGFSRDGLISQLSSQFGDGFDVNDATIAVDSMDVDWNEQAAKSAKSYLDMMGFSCAGLINQLSSSFGEKFTESQATFGARKAGGC